MEIKLYSIKDTVAGVFGSPFLASSVGLAVRQFRYMMKNARKGRIETLLKPRSPSGKPR